MSLLPSILTPEAFPFLVIICMSLVALVLVLLFTNNGPQKWFGILSVILGGGLALSWAARKAKYSSNQIIKHQEQIKKIQKASAKTDEIIVKNFEKIEKLEIEEQQLRTKGDVKDTQIAKMQNRIANKKEHFSQMKKVQMEQTQKIESLLAKNNPTLPEFSVEIEVQGFVMKGDKAFS